MKDLEISARGGRLGLDPAVGFVEAARGRGLEQQEEDENHA